MRIDELLLQAVAAHQRRVFATGKNQPVIGSQKELLRHTTERAEPADQSMLQRAGGPCRLAGA